MGGLVVQHLLAGEDEALLRRRDSLLLLHLERRGTARDPPTFSLIRSTLSVGSMSSSTSLPVSVFTLISISTEKWDNDETKIISPKNFFPGKS